MESDKNLDLLTAQEQVETQQKRLDDENWAALFGDNKALPHTQSGENVNLVRTIPDGKGGSRGVWKGTFEVSRAGKSEKSKDEGCLPGLL